MNDFLRESFSYFGLFRKISKAKNIYSPEQISYGGDEEQYFLYYEPDRAVSDKVIVWVHGGGWNAGDPWFFDYVGQCVAGQGYRMLSLGYRLSPKNKYPCQIRDESEAYNCAMRYLKARGIDASKVIVSGPSAGAHLTSIMCYSRRVQEKYRVDISNIIGYVGFGGPYSFRKEQSLTLKLLESQLFKKGYDRKKGEPVALMDHNHIPMLLIQSRHDGVVGYACAEELAEKARRVGNICELYSVTDPKDTHSWYTAGLFLETRAVNKGLDKFFSWIEER